MCDECGARARAAGRRGMCRPCYRRARRIELGLPVRENDPKVRLAARFERDALTGCWGWQGALFDGYGRFHLNGRQIPAHRAAYILHVGPIPKGLDLDHVCRNRACVNPAHLEPVTRGENTRRGMAPNIQLWRHNVCSRGHDMSIHGYQRPDGEGRFCQKRLVAANRARRAARRQS